MKRSLGVWVLGGLFVGVGGFCRDTVGRPDAGAPPSSPTLAVLYHAYGPALDRHNAEPVPDYRSWTDERMERDAIRMVRTGVSLAVVPVDLHDFADDFRRERYRRFVAVAGELGRGRLSVILAVMAPETDDDGLGMSRFVRLFLSEGFSDSPAYHRDERGCLVLLDPILLRRAVRHPAIVYAGYGVGQPWPAAVAGEIVSGSDGRVVAVAATLVDGRKSGVFSRFTRHNPREEFAALVGQAAAGEAGIVVIDAWNDYRRSWFLEPNSVDEGAGLAVLRTRLSEIRR